MIETTEAYQPNYDALKLTFPTQETRQIAVNQQPYVIGEPILLSQISNLD